MPPAQLPLVLMAAAASLAAPQINQRQVVGDVISQLQPAIQQALASLTSSSRSSLTSSPRASTRYTSVPATTSGFSGSSRFSSSSRSSPSVSSVTSSVVSQLQPSIAAAVAQALAGSRPQPARSSSAEPDYADGPSEYNFEYKVSDDESQNYIARQESRDGDTVTGSYNYINPAGTLVTVNYQADEDGFRQETSEQKGAVQMRNIPGAWDGPLAGVDDDSGASAAAVTSSRGSSRGLSQQDLIAQILASLQPRISSAVQAAVGGRRAAAPTPARTYTRPAPAPVRTYARPAPAPVRTYTRPAPQSFGPSVSSFGQNSFSRSGAGQGAIVTSVVNNLQPKISAAVRSALAGSRGASRSSSSSSSIGGLFGTPGQATVSFQTPEFNVAY